MNNNWISTNERMPDDETPVLVQLKGQIRIGELRWEIPGWEDTYSAFRYWDDPNDDGQDWEFDDVTHWQPLPLPPEPADNCIVAPQDLSANY